MQSCRAHKNTVLIGSPCGKTASSKPVARHRAREVPETSRQADLHARLVRWSPVRYAVTSRAPQKCSRDQDRAHHLVHRRLHTLVGAGAPRARSTRLHPKPMLAARVQTIGAHARRIPQHLEKDAALERGSAHDRQRATVRTPSDLKACATVRSSPPREFTRRRWSRANWPTLCRPVLPQGITSSSRPAAVCASAHDAPPTSADRREMPKCAAQGIGHRRQDFERRHRSRREPSCGRAHRVSGWKSAR